MKYKETPSQSAEYLRLVVPLMAKQQAPAHPLSYSVWYEYVSGINQQLKKEVDALLGQGQILNNEQIEALYRKFLSECDETTMLRLHADMRRLLTNLSESAAQTGEQASRFDHALERYGSRLEEDMDVGSVRQIVDGLAADTRAMRESVSGLQTRLSESRQEVDVLRNELKRAREEAVTDALTGLVNRKGFSEAMEEAISLVTRSAEIPCLLMLDIDHFKRINDNYGHLLGDKVIQFIGKTLQSSVKGKDTAARYGGEEFAVLLPETTLEGARALAENIRSTVERGRIRRMDNKESIGAITVSVGVARYRDGELASEFIGRADAALYASKHGGRNRVTVEDPA
jgi:diguanylate cyclase